MPDYSATIVSASYDRCLAYYKLSDPVYFDDAVIFCQKSSLHDGTGMGDIGTLFSTDYSSIKSEWNGSTEIGSDFFIGLATSGCGSCPCSGYPCWQNQFCPWHKMLQTDLPDGYNDDSLCLPSMIPVNFGPANAWGGNLTAVMCEFSKYS